ncbi:hypothetical protein, partial [Xanthomonas oryzae]|uniref:hypothetical protein n=1 Tax=Xanthomonas oryzae TaxID=347 RepID=UPI0009688015
ALASSASFWSLMGFGCVNRPWSPMKNPSQTFSTMFACLVAGGAGAPLNALKHHVAGKHGIWCLRGFFRGD